MITRESKSIMVADDSEFFRIKLSDILTEAGHKVGIVKDGAELIKEIKINPNGVDMILLDLQMPRMDGFKVLEWIRANGFTGKFHVLAITGVYETSQVVERLKNLGAEGLMTKAFTPEQIIFSFNDTSSTGYLLNVSEGGMFLHTKKTLAPETIIDMRFTFPGSNKLLNMKGVVKWCTQLSG